MRTSRKIKQIIQDAFITGLYFSLYVSKQAKRLIKKVISSLLSNNF